LRLSTSTSFRSIAKQAKVSGTTADISGLDPGEYFWNVTAQDARKQTSEVSETFQFTLVAQGKSQDMILEIEGTQLHGRVAEIVGRTEPGAALIVKEKGLVQVSDTGALEEFVADTDAPPGSVRDNVGSIPQVQTLGIVSTNDHGESVFETELLGDCKIETLGVELLHALVDGG